MASVRVDINSITFGTFGGRLQLSQSPEEALHPESQATGLQAPSSKCPTVY
jgi:hypothetical protein